MTADPGCREVGAGLARGGQRGRDGHRPDYFGGAEHVFCTTALFTWRLDPTDVSAWPPTPTTASPPTCTSAPPSISVEALVVGRAARSSSLAGAILLAQLQLTSLTRGISFPWGTQRRRSSSHTVSALLRVTPRARYGSSTPI